jgi:hypothetical protein
LSIENHSGAALHHESGGGARSNEVGLQAGYSRTKKVIDGHVQEPGALDVPAADEIERHVDASRLLDDQTEVRLDSLLVERVDHGDVRPAA